MYVDYQKIKAHATVVAEEIGHPFNYHEIPLESASEGDLSLINLAIDDEGHVECGKDWTSKLGINLQYCVKVRKNSPSKQVPHALALGGLFTDTTSSSNLLSLKWQSRKNRSKLKSNLPSCIKHCEDIQIKEVEVVEGKPVCSTIRKDDKLIQYSRRTFKSKSGGTEGASRARGRPRKNPAKDALSTVSDLVQNIKKEGDESAGLDFYASFEMLHEVQVLEATQDLSKNLVPAEVVNQLVSATPVVKTVEVKVKNQILEANACNSLACDGSEMALEVNITEVSAEKCNSLVAEYDSTLPVTAVPTVEDSGIQMDHQIMEEVDMTKENVASQDDSEEQHGVQGDGDILKNGVSDCGPVVEVYDRERENAVAEKSLENSESSDGKMENADAEESLKNSGRGECMVLENEAREERGSPVANLSVDEEQHVLSSVTTTNQPPPSPSAVESSEIPREICSVEDASSGPEVCSSPDNRDSENMINSEVCSSPDNRDLEKMDTSKVRPKSERKRKREGKQKTEEKFNPDGFIRSPCEGLRPRGAKKDGSSGANTTKRTAEKAMAKTRKSADSTGTHDKKKENTRVKGSHRCDLEGCRMSFKTKAELLLHKRNRCPHEGCGKKFNSHKYAMLHQRVHDDNRPLKCPWKGCKMSFKWAWARTEHLRVHTGERPYQCKVEGCGLSFRFVSDYSRHRRKTGHYVNNTTTSTPK